MGRGRIDGRPVVVGGDDFTVRGGAADASIFQKQVHAERMAHDLRMPIVRLVDGSGGGGSVKSLETERRSFVPFNPGLGARRREPRDGARRVVLPRLGRRARRGARRHEPLQRDGEGHVAAVRRRAAGRRAARRRRRQGDARRQRDPHAQRRGRRRGRDRGRGVRARPAVPLVPAVVGRRAAAARDRVDDDPQRRDESLLDGDPARPAQGLQGARRSSRPSSTATRGSSSAASTAAARSPASRGSTAGPVAVLANDPYFYAGGWTAAASEKVDALRRPRRDVPSAGRALRRQPGLRHRHRGREGGDDPLRRAGARRDLPGDDAVVLGDPAQGVRRRRRRAPGRVEALVPVRVAVGELGQPAARRRHRSRVQGAARSRRRSRRAARRDRAAARRAPVAVQDRRGVPRRGDHRPARHPAAALRVRGPRGARAPEPDRPPTACAPEARAPARRLPVTTGDAICRTSPDSGPNADHWSCEIPLDTPHPRLDVLAARGFVQLTRSPVRDSRSRVPRPRVHGLEERRRHQLRADRHRRRQARLPRLLERGRRAARQGRALHEQRGEVPDDQVATSRASAPTSGACARSSSSRRTTTPRSAASTATTTTGSTPKTDGWVVRTWLELTDNPDSYMLLDGHRSRRPARSRDRGAGPAAPGRAVRRRHAAALARRRAQRRPRRGTRSSPATRAAPRSTPGSPPSYRRRLWAAQDRSRARRTSSRSTSRRWARRSAITRRCTTNAKAPWTQWVSVDCRRGARTAIITVVALLFIAGVFAFTFVHFV